MAASSSTHSVPFQVESENVTYTDESIHAKYSYDYTKVTRNEDGSCVVKPGKRTYEFLTKRDVPKTGVLLVGLGGNNGSTMVGGIIANREGITWRTKRGIQEPNYYGSVTQASTVKLGTDESGEDVFIPFASLLPTVSPNDLVIGGWDINGMNLADAMDRAQVLDYDLQRQLYPHMKEIVPMPSIYFPDFIAANQEDRADNVLEGTHEELLEKIRSDIREFKAANDLGSVIVLWTANTERFSEVREGLNDTKDSLMEAIARSDSEVSPSTLFAVASILEGCPYINGSPQNTFVPGVFELAEEHNVHIGGDDFKSGQTKMKSVLVDFLVSAGIKPTSIVSYNHLGNNDGKNLSSAKQFRSKEISKSNVVDDMVASNPILYKEGEHPDHTVVIKYQPYVGDSKRAMDEYTSEIFLSGLNTIALHNTCEDSLLATPLIIDLVILTELLTRMEWKLEDEGEFRPFHPVLSVLSYLLKAPVVPPNTPVVNALFKQRLAMENLFRACVGLPADNNLLLEAKTDPGHAFL